MPLAIDPVGAYQDSRKNMLAMRMAEQDIAREEASIPTRNILAQQQVQAGQQNLDIGRQNLLAGVAQENRAATTYDQATKMKQATAINNAARLLKSVPVEQRPGAFKAIEQSLVDFGVPIGSIDANEAVNDQFLDQTIAATQVALGMPEGVSDLDKAKAEKYRAEAAKARALGVKASGETAMLGKDGAVTGAPDDITPLLQGLSPPVAAKAEAAYNLAGGGKDGVKALNEIVEKGSEIERRELAPVIMAKRFSDATPEEMSQLQAVMDSAKDTESGMQEAAKLRDKQRQVGKFAEYQKRASELIDRILSNDELEDVIGSFEGSGDAWVSDKEAQAIADINELSDILTGDNLDLMKGVLSNSDILMLKNISSGATNRKKGEPQFMADMQYLKDKLNKVRASANGEPTTDDLVSKYAD
jgi:hypothetical protein